MTKAIPLTLIVVGALGAMAAPAGAAPRYRIIGGTSTSISAVPYTAAVVTRGEAAENGQFCGASVIAPSAVLTAAHCVTDATAGRVDVVTGRTRLSDSGGGQRTPVSRIDVYPGWNSDTSEGDAAVLTLSRAVAAQPVTVAGPGDAGLAAAGRSAVVAGWGLTSREGSASDSLRAVGVAIHPNATCSRGYGADFRASTMLCAGGSAGDSCQGDSGGPLVTGTADGSIRQIGIVSFGSDRCADSATPGVYSRVSAMAAWITRTAGLGASPPSAPLPTTPVARFGRITCGYVRCRVEVRLIRDSGVASVLVRARGRTASRLAGARRVGPGRWVASIALPNGAVRLSAAAFTSDGRRTGNSPRLAVQVSG